MKKLSIFLVVLLIGFAAGYGVAWYTMPPTEIKDTIIYAARSANNAAPQTTINPIKSYVLNKNSRVFHKPTCYSASRIKSSNRKEFTGTREEVINMGYRPCGNCNP